MRTKWICLMMTLLLMGGQLTLSAQNNDSKKEVKQHPTPEQMIKMKAQRKAQQLMLDDATTAKFTPLYEKYLKELMECRQAYRPAKDDQAQDKAVQNKQARPDLTDKEIETLLRNQFAQSRKMIDIREKYYKEFSKILSQKQVLKIYHSGKACDDRHGKEFSRRRHTHSGQGQQPGQRMCERR